MTAPVSLEDENAALRAQVAVLQAKLAAKESENELLRKKAPRKLDPKAGSAFMRPYDGR